jgi:excisionase family DNA binding protein
MSSPGSRPGLGHFESGRLYSPDEVALLLGISRKTVYLLVERGELASYRLGRRIRFSQAHLDQFLRSVEQESG